MVASQLHFLQRFEGGRGFLEQRDAGRRWGVGVEKSHSRGRGFLVAPAKKEVSLMEESQVPKEKPTHSSKHSVAQSQCSKELSPLAKEQRRCSPAFLDDVDRTGGRSGC